MSFRKIQLHGTFTEVSGTCPEGGPARVPILGEEPRPHVLFVGFDRDDAGYLAMRELVPTSRLIEPALIRGLRIVEWDVLVSQGVNVDVPAFMHVLAFECDAVGSAIRHDGYGPLTYTGKQPSRILNVADALTAPLRRLVMSDLVPALDRMSHRPYLRTASRYGPHETSGMFAGSDDQVFVSDPDGHFIAGAFERKDFNHGGGICWSLPFRSERPAEWLALALRDWHEKTPHRVPTQPEWQTRARWASKEQREALAQLSEFEVERTKTEAALDAAEARLRESVTLASARAASGIQRLLTAQDELLVEAVTEALTTLGFTVTPMDETRAEGQPKVEDLRVADPDDPKWTNITEVKGYSGGARVSDFQKLARFASHFALEAKALPDSRWYVVNQFLDEDPDTRRPVLAGSEDDLAIFADDGGAVIDTRELFRLVALVEAGDLQPRDARSSLHAASGRYTAPQSPTED